MNDRVPIGLIGCGRAAVRLHLPALLRSPNCRLVAAADTIRSRAEAVVESVPGCAAFNSAEALLREAISGVIIATPPRDHVATAMIALEAGVSVLVEKPLAPSTEGLEELEDLERSSVGWGMIGFNRRYWEPAQRLREHLMDELDSNVFAKMVFKTDDNAWDAHIGRSDPLENLGTHQLDLVRFLFDRDIESISAEWCGDSGIQMRVTLAGGTVVEALAVHSKSYVEQIEVRKAKRRYRIWSGSPHVVPARGPIRVGLDVTHAVVRRVSRRVSPISLSYDRQLAAFAECLRAGSVPSPGLADGIAAIRAVEAARCSAATGGQEVML